MSNTSTQNSILNLQNSSPPHARSEKRMTEPDRAKTLHRIQRLSRLMDTAWRLPFTRIRFGFDSVFGLIPGAGDVINLSISAYAMWLAYKLGTPPRLMLRMLANTGIDFGVGAIPIVGDVFDLFFKSNTRNLKLLTQYLEDEKPNKV
jgi:hypothetical protein